MAQSHHRSSSRRVRRVALVAALLGAATSTSAAGELDLDGSVAARAIAVRSQPSWLAGGFGRLPEGAKGALETETLARAHAHLGFDWRPSEVWALHAHAAGRLEGEDDRGSRAGLVEAFAAFRPELSSRLALRLRAGLFFPPMSRENVGPLWSSPYTITLSALNTWIAEEVRLGGAEAVAVVRSGEHEIQLGGGVFGANDSSGALLAWRGWSFSDRLTAIGELLPLPPLSTFAPSTAFADQRDDGTRPIDELDGRAGFSGRARWSFGPRGLVQLALLDNRGDRALHRGQYAWRTRFGQVGAELRLGRHVVVVTEAMKGDTGMGLRSAGHVDMELATAYALASWHTERARLTLRYDWFRNRDLDGSAEPNDESGRAWTVAAFWTPRAFARLGVELIDVRGARPAAAFSRRDPDADGRRATAELRLSF